MLESNSFVLAFYRLLGNVINDVSKFVDLIDKIQMISDSKIQ